MLMFCIFPYQSAKSRTENRGAMSAKSKDEEQLKLPPINGEDATKEKPKVEELDEYEKLVKAIEGKFCIDCSSRGV